MQLMILRSQHAGGKRPTAQWCSIKPGFSVVPDFVVKTVVTRFPRTSIPFGRLLTSTVRAVRMDPI